DQIARWRLNLAAEGVWSGDAPVAFHDHGLQLLGTLQTLSEWQYLFGINKDGKGDTIGGLTFDLDTGLQSLTHVNLDALSEQQFFLSGSYQLSYQNQDTAETTLDLIET